MTLQEAEEEANELYAPNVQVTVSVMAVFLFNSTEMHMIDTI